jgi:hypothetical protein
MRGARVINHLSATCECRFCGPCAVDVEGPIETMPENLGEDIELAIADTLEALGWKSGACPCCAYQHRDFLAAEAKADDQDADEDAA